MRHRLSQLVFVVLVIGSGVAIGYLTPPGEWYAGLKKPAFNPPGWVFGSVWTALYAMIGVAGWRVWRRGLAVPFRTWIAQLALNFLWSPVFFGAHRIGLALAVVVLLLASCVAFIATAWSRDRLAALLFVPYAAWVAFAVLLNASILALN
ncbi:MAG: TspO/MBR family protein [Acetobacterales bacterium]